MKKIEAVEFEGKTAEEAIKKGLEQLGLTKESADIKIIDEGASGLFGLMGSKPARIKIQPRGHQEKADERLEKSIKDHLYKMFQLMSFTEEKPEINVSQSEECLVEVEFKDNKLSSLLIGKNGKVLRAIEIVLQSMLNKEFRGKIESIPKILVDVNKYTVRQKEKIKEEVNEALETAKKSGKPVRLTPMPPQLRKYVHVLLQDNPDFETISEGEDEQRRIVIKPREG
ncbi:MAG: Jag N-terminal domain-containing protein [Elusimicrobia bacterium]|nr:Jag N-terminal domain-containing protein [Elusimicrobiota bacterium]MBU2614908.1 Jag N-terminal domain-containing protein [Elusimicrobiota bacterium]